MLFKVGEKNKRMTVMALSGDMEHYILSFPQEGELNMLVDDPESSLYQDTWILRKVK